MRKALGTLVMLSVLIVSSSAALAEGWTSQGARTLDPGRNAIEAGFGFPGMKFAFHMPVKRGFELDPFLTFHYGAGTHVPIVGDALGVQIKYNLFKSGGLDLALQSETGFFVIYHPGVVMGFQLGFPEMILSYTSGSFCVFGGIKVPIGFSFYNDVYAKKFFVIIPILFNLGAEFSIAPNTNLYFTTDMGARIIAVSGGSATSFSPNVLFGIAHRF